MKSVLSHLVITLSDSVLTPFRKLSKTINKRLHNFIVIEDYNGEDKERLCEEGFDKEFFWF